MADIDKGRILERDSEPAADAGVELLISPNKMEASIVLRPPEDDGKALTFTQLSAFLARKGIVYGVRRDRLEALAKDPVYNRPVMIAEGQESTPGTDAEIIYHIKREKSLSPKVKSDGTVDFKDLDILEPVVKGALLCEKRSPTPGTPGADVLGNPLLAKPGRDANLPTGKNIVLSEDRLRLTAAIDGHANVLGKKLNVLDVFTVDGDVSHATGNVDFSGNVVVTGSVMAGFSVRAGGNIDIYGTVDSARVSAGGVLVVRGGFNGSRSGELSSGAHMTCRFIQGGQITTGGDLETTYILNATVLCSGAVNVIGKGLIAGGRVTARTSVTANNLGSANTSVSTVVEVGNDANLVKRSYEIPKELAAIEKNMRALEVSLRTLLERKKAGRLIGDQQSQLEKSSHIYSQLKNDQAELREEHADVQQRISETGQGVVKVMQKAFPGVRIIIGTDQLLLNDECSFTAIKRTREGIVFVPLR